MENTQILHSRRILFRQFTKEDLKEDLNIFNHKNIKYFTEEKIEDSKKYIEEIIENYKNKEKFNFWHLVKIGENKSIGMAKIETKEKIAQIKILIDEKIKNRGYATEALETLIQETFTSGLAEKIKIKAYKENQAWIEVIKKNNFEKYKEDQTYNYYQMTNIDYMKYFAIFGEIDI